MTDLCARLAQRLKLPQNLYQHVTDPDRRAEISDQIAEVQQQLRDHGCLATSQPWAVLVLWVSDDPNDPAVVHVNELPAAALQQGVALSNVYGIVITS
jgi:hypothetical protein